VGIGVSDIEKSIRFYSNVLGYSHVVRDEIGVFADLEGAIGGGNEFRRVLLQHPNKRKGAFSDLLGPSEIELFQVEGREPKKILLS